MRSKKAFLNTTSSLILELVTIISGFIVPRLVLSRFGSSYHGITSSITQFISYISLLTAGIGGVTRASLYKPLEEKDSQKISAIIKATENFIRRVAYIFAIGLSLFAILYPLLVLDDFGWFFSFTLVLILGMGTFVRYYFGLTYQMLLQADQKQYVIRFIEIITTVVNTLVAALLIKLVGNIHAVKLGSSLIFMANPIFVFLYVRHRYKIDTDAEPDNSAIEQRWDAFAHQIANFANNNTDLVILSFFTNLKEISVYTVYYGVSNGIRKLVTSVSTGVEAAFGNMIAKGEKKVLERNLSLFEFLIYSLSTLLFTCLGILIVSFVSVYTKGVTDVNYIRPEFGYLIAISEFFNCIRIPYQAVARAAGHYRQTRNGAIFEAVINIVISLVLVKRWGLVGVTVGTLCAMLFRTLQYSIYISKNIVNRSVFVTFKRLLISGVNSAGIVGAVSLLHLGKVTTYYTWFLNGLAVFGIALVITVGFSMVFYREDTKGFIRLVQGITRGRRKT